MQRSLILAAMMIVAGCNWTPQVETVLHAGPKGIVSLRTVDDSAFQADHPADLSPELIEKVLQGAAIQEEARLLERLLSGPPKPTPVFSQEQTAFLAPLIADALTKATPEEEIFFQSRSREDGSPTIEGTFLVHGTTVMLRWKTPSPTAKLPKANRPLPASADPSKVRSYTVHFSPKEAVHKDPIRQATNYLSAMNYDTLVIDYDVLALLVAQPEEPPPDRNRQASTEQSTIADKGSSIRSTQQVDPVVEMDKSSPRDQDHATTNVPSQQEETIEELKAQIEALKNELAEQRAVLEKLKNSVQ